MARPDGLTLVGLARRSLEAALDGLPPPPLPADPALLVDAACFVTLTEDGRLRGCIGSLAPHRPLALDVIENARRAGLEDPRFPPLAARDLPRVRIEISVLGPREPLPAFPDRVAAAAALRPGVDGLVLTAGPFRALFLPQVWETLPEPDEFLRRLLQKAGLPAGYWSPKVRLDRFGVERHEEAAPPPEARP